MGSSSIRFYYHDVTKRKTAPAIARGHQTKPRMDTNGREVKAATRVYWRELVSGFILSWLPTARLKEQTTLD
jgi:hypothetical protein